MKKDKNIKSYTVAELKAKRADSRTDLTKVDAMTDKELERRIAEDEDEKDLKPDWTRARLVLPAPKQSVHLRLEQHNIDFFVILMIDDDEEDFSLIKEALVSRRLKVDLYWAQDGDEAMNFLFRKSEYVNAPTPNLILLDLNMPGKNGFDVLQDIKAHKDLRKIPVVILTSSRDEKSVSRGYNTGASSFMLKPLTFDEMANAMQSLCEYWFALVQLPKSPAEPARKTVRKESTSSDNSISEPIH